MLLLAQSQIVEIEKAVSGRSLQDHPMDLLQELSNKDSEKRQYDKVSLSYNTLYLTFYLSIFTHYWFPSYSNCLILDICCLLYSRDNRWILRRGTFGVAF